MAQAQASELGNFTRMAEHYANRPAYSRDVLAMQLRTVAAARPAPRFADIGAGTGKLTQMLVELGLSGSAVEPNDAMRSVGERGLKPGPALDWRKGTAEDTGLPAGAADWVLMASAFHWTEPRRSLPEFRRILRPGGYLTLLWNPRDLEASAFQKKIDSMVHEMAPGMQRRSSGAKQYTEHLERTLGESGCFRDVVFMEAAHVEVMSRDRYLGAWRSVNDIQAQAGPERFAQIMAAIERETQGMERIEMPYRTRAWFARRVD
jgi:SAM-dependent methyltransferase